MTLPAGARLGPYEVRGLLGAGGMGEVYRARDARLGREVAVKVLPASAASDPDRRIRFEQEAKAAGSLSHPNLLTVFDVGSHEASAAPPQPKDDGVGAAKESRVESSESRTAARLLALDSRLHDLPNSPRRATNSASSRSAIGSLYLAEGLK